MTRQRKIEIGWQVWRETRAQATALWLGIAYAIALFGGCIAEALGNPRGLDELGLAALGIWLFWEAVSLPADIAWIWNIYHNN